MHESTMGCNVEMQGGGIATYLHDDPAEVRVGEVKRHWVVVDLPTVLALRAKETQRQRKIGH